MTDKKVICLACGVFHAEMAALVSRGILKADVVTLDSMLHMAPGRLAREMDRIMAREPQADYLLVYGDCHPHMHDIQARENVSRVDGINCCSILLGRRVYRELQKAQAFLFLPEWTLRWREIFTRELGFQKPDLLQAFMKEHRKKLVYVDTGVMPIPEKCLEDIRRFFDMPIEIRPVSLDTLWQGMDRAMDKFRRDPPYDGI